MITRGRLVFLTCSVALVVLLAAGTMVAASEGKQDDGSDSLYKYLSVFTEVLGLVDRAYVEETDEKVLLAGAYEGTVDALDPFSLYVPAEALPTYLESREVGDRRSGLRVFKERGVVYVVGVVDGSPAAKAGIERGDVLSVLQGMQTRPMPLFKIFEILAGAPGTEIEVERLRLGQTDKVRFALGDYPRPAVALTVQDGVPLLRVPIFDADTATQVAASLAAAAGETPGLDFAGLDVAERGRLLLDLRSVAGGDPAAAYAVARLFVRGDLGALLARGHDLDVFRGEAEPTWQGTDLVVLIDRGTQGAAEVLATVLRQGAGATALVGERSFGHSGRQELVALSNGARLQLTTAFYTGPDRKPLRQGLEPDVVVRASPFADDDEEAPSDAILQRGVEVLKSGAAAARKAAATPVAA